LLERPGNIVSAIDLIDFVFLATTLFSLLPVRADV
jgi:hypothetical protein